MRMRMSILTPKMHSSSIHNGVSSNAKRYVTPSIGLHHPAKKELRKDEILEFNLRTNPTAEGSPQYKLTIPYFANGTPEELLIFIKNLRQVIAGQNATAGPAKYQLARRVLQGDALAAFNAAADVAGNETNEHFEVVIQGLIRHVFPRKALINQKRYMYRFLRKPRDMKIRDFMGRVTELNEYLPLFPPFEEHQGLNNEEIMDIAEFATPTQWQRTMVLQGFDPIIHTPQEFVEFCERLEMCDPVTSTNMGAKPRANPKGGHIDGKSRANRYGKKREREDTYCEYHKVHGHSTGECKVVLSQAKKMRAAWESRGQDKNQYPKNRTWNKHKQPTKEAHNFQEAVKNAVKEMLTASKKENEPDQLDMEAFQELQLSDDEEKANDDPLLKDSDSE